MQLYALKSVVMCMHNNSSLLVFEGPAYGVPMFVPVKRKQIIGSEELFFLRTYHLIDDFLAVDPTHGGSHMPRAVAKATWSLP